MFLSFRLILPIFFILPVVPVHAQTNDLWPGAYPLAVRSPYLQAWQSSTNGTPITSTWPMFWEGNAILGWAGHIRIDKTVYRWLGDDGSAPNTPANLTGRSYTPTRSTIFIQAGPMNLNVTFLSPIEPADWVKQSMPFAYITLEGTSADGQPHNVQVYSDISGEWLSGTRTNSNIMTWKTASQDNSIILQSQLATPLSLTEISDQADDGTSYYAMQSRPNLTFQIGQDAVCRGGFVSNGNLQDTVDPNFRGIPNDWPVMAISVDLGNITTIDPVTWAIGFVRDPVVNYTTSTGEVQSRSPYFRTQYPTDPDAISAFLADYEAASTRATNLDNAVLQNASSISSRYADLVSLAARQAFGGIEISVSNGSDGSWNMSDVKIFMRDMGNSRRVNPVEVLYSAFPTFLYFNASFAGPLLTPLLEFQDSTQYTQPYAAKDLGGGYPIVSGSDYTHGQGVEQCGNMLIMALAHARFTGDGSIIQRHYSLLKNWATYLTDNTLTPINQQTADQQDDANMTNLVIKGLIAIQAMSEISEAVGQSSDAESFGSYVATNINIWQSLALSTDQSHFLSSYGEESSSALMYNLFADLLLGTNLVPQTLYQKQTQFYQSQMTSTIPFGLPIDSDDGTKGNSAWMLFTAATMTDPNAREQMISFVWVHASSNVTQGPFPYTYDVSTGDLPSTNGSIASIASPAQGAMFAILALQNLQNQTIVVPPSSPNSSSPNPLNGGGGSSVPSKHKSNIGAIVGGIVGGFVALALAVLAVVLFRRWHARNEEKPEMATFAQPEPFVYGPVPTLEGRAPIGSHTTTTTIREKGAIYDRNAGTVTSADAPTTSTSAYSSSHGPASSHQPPSSNSEPIISPSEVRDLRMEMENLRRAMQGITVESAEPPPTYQG